METQKAQDYFWTAVNWLVDNSPSLLTAVIVLVGGWYLSKFAARAITSLLPRAYGIDKNFAPLLSQVARYGIIVFAVVTALSVLGVASASIYAVLGAAGLAVALALQGTLSNIAAGIMLIWLRPIAIGEFITSGAIAGVVVEIGLFGTRLRTTSGLYVFAPNQIIWASAITNHSREARRRIDVNVTFPDTVNIAKARKILLRIATADRRVLVDPAPHVHVEAFTGDTAVLQLRSWVKTQDYLDTLFALTEEAKHALNRELKSETGEKPSISVSQAAASPDNPSPGN